MQRYCCLLLLPIFGCSDGPPPIPPADPPVVTVEKPVERMIDNYFEFTGYLRAAREVEIRAQVTGYLKAVKFTDGQIVRAGDVLYEIDPEPFVAAKQNAAANLATAEAGLKKANSDVMTFEEKLLLAKSEYDRQVKLKDSGSEREFDLAKTNYLTSRTELSSATANRDSLAAARDASMASLRKSDFDLKNCTIRLDAKDITAPENLTMKTPPDKIVGRVSRSLLTEGNLVQAGQSLLCKVVSLNPIYGYWDVDELTSLEYRRRIHDDKTIPDPILTNYRIPCRIELKNEKDFPHAGEINYIAPEVSRGTASREVRAVFLNNDFRLSAGDSIRIKVTSGPATNRITIPEYAVGIRQQQKYVYVVVKKEGQDIAEFRPVTIGPVREINGVRMQIIDKGLTVNDLVVVNGLLRVRPGAPVKATEQASPVTPGK